MTKRTIMLIQNLALIVLTAWVYTLSGSAWSFILLLFFWTREDNN